MSFEIKDFFPVYDILRSQIETLSNKDTSLTESEIRDLITKINSLDKIGRDMIYVFTRIHSLRYSDAKILDVPYGGTKLSNKIDGVCDVKFDVRDFPPILSRMLLRFSELHLRKITEETDKTNPKKQPNI